MNNILIAEDEKLIRAGIRTMTERSGVPFREIFEAKNGEEALAILREKPVDLLLTDIRMPKMDGIDLVRALHAEGYSPVIMAISGYDDFSYAVEMLRNGVSEYLLKPLERDKFKEALEKAEALVHEKDRDLKDIEAELEVARQEKLRDFFTSEARQAKPSEALVADAKKYFTESRRTRRLQLVGTGKVEELNTEWHSFFEAARRGYVDGEEFIQELILDAKELADIYSGALSEEKKTRLLSLKESDILACGSLENLEETFMNFLIGMQRDSEALHEEPVRRKISLAIRYIEENYASDINMAVVSNYVSMNYSLFSYVYCWRPRLMVRPRRSRQSNSRSSVFRRRASSTAAIPSILISAFLRPKNTPFPCLWVRLSSLMTRILRLLRPKAILYSPCSTVTSACRAIRRNSVM